MNLILLGGENPASEKWIEAVEASLEGQFETSEILRYQHWQTGAESIDVDSEAARLAELAAAYERSIIVAKSAGTWVTLRAVQEGLQPDKCVFIGTAVSFARNIDVPIDSFLEGHSIPTLFVQKTEDPAIGFADLESLLTERHVTNQTMMEVQGDNHHYENVTQLGRLITDFAF